MVKAKAAVLIIFAVLTVFVLVYPNSAAAAENLIISASKVEGSKGDQVEITVSAEKAAGSEGGQFVLTYDRNLVKPVSIEPGEFVLSAENNLHMANLDYAPGELIFMWVTVKADTSDSGDVCRVSFELLKEGATALSFKDLIVVTGNGGNPTAIAGEIKVSSAASGQETAEEPSQDNDTAGSDSAANSDASGEEVIGGDNGEDEKIATPGRSGVNPVLIVAPIFIIIVLAAVYYLIRKPGKKKQKENSKLK